MKKVKVAIIGCGSIAIHRHVPEYADNASVDIVAFCDLRIERADELAEKYGGAAYTDYKKMLRDLEIDAVSVCLPNALHAPVTIDAAEAGCHVLCEKPMATNAQEALDMIKAAKDHNVLLMIGHNQRMMPPHVKAKEILQTGELGRVISFRTAFGHGGPENWSIDGADSWFFRKEEAYVGAMGDLGVHKADLIRWMLDDEVVEVSAFVENLDKTGSTVDDNAVCLFRMGKGAIGTMTASWTYYKGEDNSTVLYCENGVIKIGTDPQDQVIVEKRDGQVNRYNVGAIATNDVQVGSGVIASFINSVVNGTTPSITGQDGLKSLQVILACMEAAATKKNVTL
ncbi:MAG: Gfo/Idh/MocA family oxidoreductase [Paenibacillaceae bacterium]